MDDEELLELISERKTISKTVEDYEGRKSTSLTTAVRTKLFVLLFCLLYFCFLFGSMSCAKSLFLTSSSCFRMLNSFIFYYFFL